MAEGLEQCVVRVPELGVGEDDWKRCDGAPEGPDAIMCREHWSMVPRDIRLKLWTLQAKAKQLHLRSYGTEWGEYAQAALAHVMRTVLKHLEQAKREKADSQSCDVATWFEPCNCGGRWTLAPHDAAFWCDKCGEALVFTRVMRAFNGFLVGLEQPMSVCQINALAEMIYNPGGENA